MSFRILFFAIFIFMGLFACKTVGGKQKTPSGYEYTVVKSGQGQEAKKGDFVAIAITVKGDDGKVLQEVPEGPNMPSLPIPDTFATGKMANPVIEVLLGSKVGDSIVLIMPIDSLKDQVPPDMLTLKYVSYEISIKKIETKEAYEKRMMEAQAEMMKKAEASQQKMPAIEELVKTTLADYKSKKLEVETTKSGIKYYILTPGEGDNAVVGKKVSVQYYGNTLDGKMFDNSFTRGQPIEFPLGMGQVIPGWDEGLTLFKKGGKGFLFIPGNLAYGEQGNPQGGIGPNAELMFYVELEDIK
jgi:FKBP-type peptidyl-prolyl cis-trans isomerase FkpA